MSKKPTRVSGMSRKQRAATMIAIRDQQAGRSPRAISMDSRQTARQVLDPDTDDLYPWQRHPNRYDVQGVDTRAVAAPTVEKKTPSEKPKPKIAPDDKGFIKGGATEVSRKGVSYLMNEGNTVARYRSWDEVNRSLGGLLGFYSYQGMPMTQEELNTHYPELKTYTGLTKSKISSDKVWFKNVNLPMVVQCRDHVYMVAPTISEKPFWQVPESMSKPKLTAEQRKYLDAHKKRDVAGYWQETEVYQVGVEEAIREGKRLQKQGERVQIGEFISVGVRPTYTVMVLKRTMKKKRK